MLRVAVVEDDAKERKRIQDNLLALPEQMEIEYFASGMAFAMAEMKNFDIVLMDIDMPGMNGIETAKRLRAVNKSAVLVFVTNMVQFAIAGYEVEALDFIVKPINPYSFALKMKRAVCRTAKRSEDMLTVRTENVLHRIPILSIRYIEVSGHYITYHTSSGTYQEYATMKEVKERLRTHPFAQCSQSYLVNMKYITSVSREKVVIEDTPIFISRRMRGEFLDAVGRFFGGETR